MKKILKITLNKEDLEALKGAGPKKEGLRTPSVKSGCGCNCYNCTWQDGGGGFSVGMIYSGIY